MHDFNPLSSTKLLSRPSARKTKTSAKRTRPRTKHDRSSKYPHKDFHRDWDGHSLSLLLLACKLRMAVWRECCHEGCCTSWRCWCLPVPRSESCLHHDTETPVRSGTCLQRPAHHENLKHYRVRASRALLLELARSIQPSPRNVKLTQKSIALVLSKVNACSS